MVPMLLRPAVFVFMCIITGHLTNLSAEEFLLSHSKDNQNGVIELAQASGSADLPSSGMGAGGQRPPANMIPRPHIPPAGMGGTGLGGPAGQAPYPSGATCRTPIGICPRGEWRPVGEPCYCQRISDGGLDPGQIIR